MLLSLKVITGFGSFPVSGGPPLGGRAGERVARMLLDFCSFVLLFFCSFVLLYLSYGPSIAKAITAAIEKPIERLIGHTPLKQIYNAPSLRSVMGALRDAQALRGSAP